MLFPSNTVSFRTHRVRRNAIVTVIARIRFFDVLSERSIDSALCCYSVASRWEELRYTRGIEPSLGQTEGSPKPRSAGTDDNGIVLMVLVTASSDVIPESELKITLGTPTMTGYWLPTNGDASFARSGAT